MNGTGSNGRISDKSHIDSQTSPSDRRTPVPHTPLAKHRLHPAYSHELLQLWHNDAPVLAHDLVYPVFITDDDDAKQEISSMPNQYRLGINRINELITPLVADGLRAVLLFGVVESSTNKDSIASYATSPQSPIPRVLRHLRSSYPSLYLMCDVCLCAYTNHGHCGICHDDGTINNQASIERLSQVALYFAQAGADCIAPSDMMDGRIGSIKQILIQEHLDHIVTVCSYAVKFASCFYGPFRDAAHSGAQFGDRSRYQLPTFARSLALRAVDRDIEEGADMVMVKPGMPYLDLIREVKDRVNVPVAVYQVSGEYAMLMAASEQGAFTLEAAVMETLGGMRRAGAHILITYFAPLVLQILKKQR